MTVVLAVVAAVAVLGVLVAGFMLRRVGLERRAADQRADAQGARLTEAATRLEEAERERKASQTRATAAENRVKDAEQRVGDAERRAGDAERRVSEALRRADEALQRAAAGGHTSYEALWELERMRLRREWLDVVGPGEDLPVPWDTTVPAVMATELAIIREVMGTPSEMTGGPGPAAFGQDSAALAARTGVELLRRLARSGQEMRVEVAEDAVTVRQYDDRDTNALHGELGDIIEAAGRIGLVITATVADETAEVRFTAAG